MDATLLEVDVDKVIDKLEGSSDKETFEHDEIKEPNKLENQKNLVGDEPEKSEYDNVRDILAPSEGKQDESDDMVQESDGTEIGNEEHHEKPERTSLNKELIVEDKLNYGDQEAAESHTTEVLDENKSNNEEASEHLPPGGKIDEYEPDTFKDDKASEKDSSPELPMKVELETSVDLEGSEDSSNAVIERKNEQKDEAQIDNALAISPSNLTVDEPRGETEDTGTKEDVMDEGNPGGGALEKEEFLDADEMLQEKEEQRKVTFGASGNAS